MAKITAVAARELKAIEAGRTADLDMLEDVMRYVTGLS